MKNYLDLKSFENMIQLQRTLRVMEEQINSAIRAYNSNVLVLNDKIVSISTIVLAAYLEYQLYVLKLGKVRIVTQTLIFYLGNQIYGASTISIAGNHSNSIREKAY